MLPNILFVDDDRHFSPLVQEYLEAKGFRVTLVHNAEEGYRMFRKGGYNCCLLDVKMPMKDGFALAEEIRALDSWIPIVFLTAESRKEKRIQGLEIGADDYITKPFSLEELYLRIKAILKRTGLQAPVTAENQQFSIGRFRFDAAARTLQMDGGAVINLTAIEASLLKMFCESDQGIIQRDIALKKIWNDEDQLHGRSLNVYVSKIRHYLKSDPGIQILNVHGVGYRLVR